MALTSWKTILHVTCALLTSAVGAQTPKKGPHWVGTWAAAPIYQPKSDKTVYTNATIRNVVHVSLGGSQIRLKISNAYGQTPLLLGEVHAALSTGGSRTDTATDRAITFGGAKTVVIPAGAMAVSDVFSMVLPPLSDLAVSIYLPEQKLPLLTYHALASTSTYHVDGDAVGAAELQNSRKTASWMLLTGVDVEAPDDAGAVVTLGDSITDGAHSTVGANTRWPDVLAARLHASASTAHIGVLNQGIGGNRILHDGAGTNAMARFDRDVLSQSGVKYVIVMESINDIRYATNPRNPDDIVTSDQLIWSFGQLATRAHARGVKMYCATVTPFIGSKNASAEGEEMRLAINQWIRTSDACDAVLDFDKATRDPGQPNQFWPANDSGDHLHPGDAGYKAIGGSIDLTLFR